MKNQIKKFLLLFTVTILAFSCSSDDNDNNNPPSGSRKIKYEITGNYVGPLTVIYTAQSGAQTYLEVTSLPWSLEFVMSDSAYNSQLTINGGTASQVGKSITAKIFQGDVQKREGTATGDSRGFFTLSLPAIVF